MIVLQIKFRKCLCMEYPIDIISWSKAYLLLHYFEIAQSLQQLHNHYGYRIAQVREESILKSIFSMKNFKAILITSLSFNA